VAWHRREGWVRDEDRDDWVFGDNGLIYRWWGVGHILQAKTSHGVQKEADT